MFIYLFVCWLVFCLHSSLYVEVGGARWEKAKVRISNFVSQTLPSIESDQVTTKQ